MEAAARATKFFPTEDCTTYSEYLLLDDDQIESTVDMFDPFQCRCVFMTFPSKHYLMSGNYFVWVADACPQNTKQFPEGHDFSQTLLSMQELRLAS